MPSSGLIENFTNKSRLEESIQLNTHKNNIDDLEKSDKEKDKKNFITDEEKNAN